jgi:hypothetical protein
MFEMNTAATTPRLIVRPVPTWIPRIADSGTPLSRSHLRDLGLERRAFDAVFRVLDVVVLPGYSRPLVRAEDYRALLQRCAYADDRVRA